MKHNFILFICIFCWLFSSNAQNTAKKYFYRPVQFVCEHPFDDTTKWAITCRVWGLLKYYHPNVTAGKLDWDDLLLDAMPAISSSTSEAQVNSELKKMLEIAGSYNSTTRNTCSDSLRVNVNLCWLEHSFLDNQIKEELKAIASLNVDYPSYYGIDFNKANGQLSPQNEKDYYRNVYSSLEFRLLALFRYWNVIYYYSPHKYLMDKSWDETLLESIPLFIDVTDKQSYQIAFLKLAAALNDGHGYISGTNLYDGACVDLLEYIDGKTVVRNETGGTRKGDIIKRIGNRDINSIRDSLSLLISTSTKGNKEYRINSYVAQLAFFQENDLTIFRDSKEIIIHILPESSRKQNLPMCKRISTDIGYVDLSKLTTDKMDSILIAYSDASGIIFDLRNTGSYAYNVPQLECYLSESKVLYMPEMVVWDLEHPGSFLWKRDNSSIVNSTKCSHHLTNVVFLINESTQSFTETQAWIAQNNFHATLIGRRTSGAWGQVVWIPLPGKQRAAFSGFGLFSPNGNALQREGIIPDVEVHPTLESIKAGKDEILEAAINYLRNN
ncbi:S41 family peptidase [Draconibacterium sediminis]|uniref:Tail specific protease domain-containing protein n=1 Tax=Draconibacterium sediminis TaxID=1544798 RepID=A0A0D8J4T5_9BACT|nr:S41 family peptidase [Draconibacterium sediminis]KJF41917.1 hypothetical protein LH29_21730 [Draconibacterium sediminis]